jgi:hypothetical protein
MEKEYAGVYQLENGYRAYRFVITLENGKKKAQKRVKDESGNPYKTQRQAAKAREMALKQSMPRQ